ncbi:MAG: YqiJ family protein [Myxococcales bacterium]|nr:YqiJ family protein [Myxococcales bacterium]
MLTAPHNLPFSVALGVMLGLSVLELLSTLLGAGLSNLVDGMLPDFDFETDVEVDGDLDVDGSPAVGPVAQVLDWLHVGRVPTLMLLMVFLASFGGAGLVVQQVSVGALGAPLSVWLSSIAALALALPLVHVSGSMLGRLLPSDESSAISREGLVGRFATIIGGTAMAGNPAQAKLQDEHGQTHYVLVEPESEHQRFPCGSQVILIAQAGAVFKAVGSDLPRLQDV